MSGPDNVDGCMVLFRATPIHEGPLKGYTEEVNRKIIAKAQEKNETPKLIKDGTGNFRSNTYNVARTDKEITLYRLYGGSDASKDGSWWTPIKPEALGKNALDSRIDYAVLGEWKNTMEKCAEIRVPADTLLFTGYAGEQKTALEYKHGGKCQVYLPREIMDGLKKYNETGNTSAVHAGQKEVIKNWENRNINLTNSNGKALQTNPAQLQKLHDSAKSINVPNLSTNNANTFKQASVPQRLNTVTFQPPTAAAREGRKVAEQSVKNTFISNNNIPRNQCYISSPWPGGIEFVQSMPLYNQEVKDSTKFNKLKMSIQNSSLWVTNQNQKHQIQKFGILSKTKILPSLSPEEVKGLYEACTKSTKTGIMISLELFEDHIDTITDGFNPTTYPQIYETIKEADALLGNFIFGTNLFQAAVEENSKIELTKSDVPTYQNPYDVEYQLLKGRGNSNLQAQKDVNNFSFIGPHPKFVINKKAKLIVKDDMILCDRCPFDISLRGVYVDFYGNTYYDDEGERCYKNHAFINDFRNNFWNYMEVYPILKKVATYAIFVGAMLNDTLSLKNDKTDYQKLSKIPRKGSASNGLQEIEIKLLQVKEEIFRQKTSNPFAWILLGNEWCKLSGIKQ